MVAGLVCHHVFTESKVLGWSQVPELLLNAVRLTIFIRSNLVESKLYTGRVMQAEMKVSSIISVSIRLRLNSATFLLLRFALLQTCHQPRALTHAASHEVSNTTR
jgi:hypothetical protein